MFSDNKEFIDTIDDFKPFTEAQRLAVREEMKLRYEDFLKKEEEEKRAGSDASPPPKEEAP